MKEIINIWSRVARYTSVNKGNNTDNHRYHNGVYESVNLSEPHPDYQNASFLSNIFNYKTWPKRTFIYLLLGLLGILSGCFVLFAHPYDFLFRLKIIFAEGGEIFELWRAPPVQLLVKIYLFNVTNKDAFMRGDEKLRVQEVGPYVYQEMLQHGDVVFNDNGTVSAIPQHPLIWRPDLSEGHTEDDILLLPNIALLSIAHVMADASYFTRFGLNVLIRQTESHPLVEMTAKEFMFGYQSSLVTIGNHLMPSWISFDKLGLIDRMYNFDGDSETVYTGVGDASKAGLLDTYNGRRRLPQWPEEGHCGRIEGASDGTKFKGYLNPEEEIWFFRKSLCRAAPLVYKNASVIKGLTAFEYALKENALDNGHVDPDNNCFCRNGNCLPRGLIDVTDCYYGFPIALSYPHFYDSDPSLVEAIDGSYPSKEKHHTYFYIQPDSGLPLNLSAKFQINMVLGKIGSMAHVGKFDSLVLPLLWFDIRMPELPDDINAHFKLYLNVLPSVEAVIMYLFFFGGLWSLLLVVYKLLYTNRGTLSRTHPISKHRISGQSTVDNADKKINNYLKVQRRDTMSSKEFEVYFNGLVAPLNQEIDDIKQETV